MKIHRYSYISRNLKIDTFSCALTHDNNIVITADHKLFGKVIDIKSLDQMLDNENYIMWSLKNDVETKSLFKKACIRRKERIKGAYLNKVKDIENEIEMLRGDFNGTYQFD